MVATVLAALLASLQLVPAQVVGLADQSPLESPPSPSTHEELTLEALGLGAMTTAELDSTIEVLFPPPGAPLANRGSFVRVFFAHSSDVGSGSSLVVSVNGQALTTVPLTSKTAPGTVFEVTVPATVFNLSAANVLQAHFRLDRKSSGGAFARLDKESHIHYQLVGEDERAVSLAAYPYTLLSRRPDLEPSFVLMLPAAPNPAELSAAWRIVADLGRRAGLRHLKPWVTTGAVRFEADGIPRLLVGRADRLEGASALLQTAGYKVDRGALRSLTGSTLRSGDGLAVALPSPADRLTPVVVATGATDAAVAAAASGLAHSDTAPLVGTAAVVSNGEARATVPSRQLDLNALLRHEFAVRGNGEHQVATGFEAAAAERTARGRVVVSVRSSGLEAPTRHSISALIVAINGHVLGTASLEFDGLTRADFALPGSVLVAGPNTISFDFHVDGGPSGQVVHVIDATRIDLPGPPRDTAGLAGLPYPFLDGTASRPTMVLVPDSAATTLTAAATALVALGSRAVATIPAFNTGTVGRSLTATQASANLIVVGAEPRAGRLEPLGRALKLTVSTSGSVSGLKPGEPVGTLESLRLPGADAHQAIWIGGTSPSAVTTAGLALYQRELDGGRALVDEKGLARAVRDAGGDLGGEPSLRLVVKALIGIVVVSMLALFALALRRRPQEVEA